MTRPHRAATAEARAIEREQQLFTAAGWTPHNPNNWHHARPYQPVPPVAQWSALWRKVFAHLLP